MDLDYAEFQKYINDNGDYLIDKIAEYYEDVILTNLSQQDLIDTYKKGYNYHYFILFYSSKYKYLKLSNEKINIPIINNIDIYNSYYNRINKFMNNLLNFLLRDNDKENINSMQSNFCLKFTKSDATKLFYNHNYFNKKNLDIYDDTINNTLYEESLKYPNPENLYIKAINKFLEKNNHKYKNFDILFHKLETKPCKNNDYHGMMTYGILFKLK
jgi:hypothetical protein